MEESAAIRARANQPPWSRSLILPETARSPPAGKLAPEPARRSLRLSARLMHRHQAADEEPPVGGGPVRLLIGNLAGGNLAPDCRDWGSSVDCRASGGRLGLAAGEAKVGERVWRNSAKLEKEFGKVFPSFTKFAAKTAHEARTVCCARETLSAAEQTESGWRAASTHESLCMRAGSPMDKCTYLCLSGAELAS